MTTLAHNLDDHRAGVLKSIATSIEPAFPTAADSLRGIANSFSESVPAAVRPDPLPGGKGWLEDGKDLEQVAAEFYEQTVELRALNQTLSREVHWLNDTNAGLRARLRLAENVMSTIEDEHYAAESGRYCEEGSCGTCKIIERVNLALAGEA